MHFYRGVGGGGQGVEELDLAKESSYGKTIISYSPKVWVIWGTTEAYLSFLPPISMALNVLFVGLLE